MPKKKKAHHLTRREEQIMSIIFRQGEASVADLERLLPGSPTSGAVRRLLNLLHGKGAIAYHQDGARKIYRATVEKEDAGAEALHRVVDTFFGGSAVSTVGALFNSSELELTDEEKDALSELIENARKSGR